MKSVKWGLYLFLFVATLLVFAKPTRAGSDGVYFSEIAWRGSSVSTADEFIELINLSDNDIDLRGWQVLDLIKNEPMVNISSGTIKPRGYFLIANSTRDHQYSKGESVLNIDPDLVESDISLSNSDFEIALVNPAGETVDTAGDGREPFFGEYEGQIASMARKNPILNGDLEDAWEPTKFRKNIDPSILDYATPENSSVGETEEPPVENTPVYDKIRLTEIMLHPERDYNGDGNVNSADEWIEIANIGEESTNLKGWAIADRSGKQFAFGESTLEPFGFFVLSKNESGISINDSGETLTLSSPNNDVIDKVEIPSARSYESSYSRWADQWYFSTSITPGRINEVVQRKSANKPTIEKLQQGEGLPVKFEAIVKSVERDRISVEYLGHDIDILTSQIDFDTGQKISINGLNRSGENPIIEANKIVSSKTSSKKEATISTVVDSPEQFETVTLEKIISNATKVTFPKETQFEKLSQISGSDGFNLGKLLLYFYSVFLLVIMVIFNELYHRVGL